MENNFVPYELALKLKELGFDEECLGFYTELQNLVIKENVKQQDCVTEKCIAPLWQQAFDWLREKYNLYAYIRIGYIGYSNPSKTWDFSIYDDISLKNPKLDEKGYSGFRGFTYEEARLECLKKLIEIAKEKCGIQ